MMIMIGRCLAANGISAPNAGTGIVTNPGFRKQKAVALSHEQVLNEERRFTSRGKIPSGMDTPLLLVAGIFIFSNQA